MARQLLERAAGERADRIERDVAEQLDPDLLADARRDRAPEAGADEGFGDGACPFRSRAVWLAEADPIALGVPDDAGLDDVGGEVGERSDDAARLDGVGDDAAWIDALETKAVELAAMRPGNTTTGCRSAC